MLIILCTLDVKMHEENVVVGIEIIGGRGGCAVSRAQVGEIIMISVKDGIVVRRSVGGRDSYTRGSGNCKIVVMLLGDVARDLVTARYDKRRGEVSGLVKDIHPTTAHRRVAYLNVSNIHEGELVTELLDVKSAVFRAGIVNNKSVNISSVSLEVTKSCLVYIRTGLISLGSSGTGNLVGRGEAVALHHRRLGVMDLTDTVGTEVPGKVALCFVRADSHNYVRKASFINAYRSCIRC